VVKAILHPKLELNNIMNDRNQVSQLVKSKNFCTVPWMHIHVINDGRVFPCCQTPIEDENALGNVKEQRIIEIVNSDKYKTMRKNMLEDKPLPDSCERCTKKEDSGINTMRTGMNDQYAETNLDFITQTADDGAISEARLQYWDFRFSNYCNLACRTCSPLFSTKWHAESFKLHKVHFSGPKALIDLKEAKMFWDDLDGQIQHLKSIQMAGGEPVIMEEHWKLIQMLEQKNKTDVSLRYSTNATKLTYKGINMLDVWKKFKYVHLSLSIDGIGPHFDYIRHHGHWDEVKANLLAIRETKSIDYWMHPTISILNIFHITDMHKELFDLDLIPNRKLFPGNQFSSNAYFIHRFHLNPLFTPNSHSIKALPKELKTLATDHLLTYGEMMNKNHGIPMSGWQSLVDFMWASDDSHLFQDFIDHTKKLDELRSQDFTKLDPILAPYFKASN
jgi:radical SAM protein with 4Fe4S-binding SPASM domain